MSDDLDLRGIDQSHEPDPEFRAALERRIAAIVAGSDPGSVTEPRDLATIDLEPARPRSAPKRHSRRVAYAVVAATVAAAVVTTMVVISRDHAPAPADTPLQEPSPDEVAAASNGGVYPAGSGPTEVTASGSYVSLRRCAIGVPPDDEEHRPCDGPDGWAYVTGSVDSPGVHSGLLGSGLLGSADEVVLSALDDRFFVASTASFSPDPQSAPAWLIDSVTGQRALLTWHDQPATLNAPGQVLVLFPAPNPIPSGHTFGSTERFLPRVVDRRDWTVRPLSVPEGATADLAIHQPGSGRIWIGTAPEGGDIGLAYTDDGGASWTDVELPPSLRPTSAELAASEDPGFDDLLVVAASGDHVAVTKAWGGAPDVSVSADAGASWNPVLLDPPDGNGRKLFVISDDRLMVALTVDNKTIGVLVSSSPSDWSQLEVPDRDALSAEAFAAFDSAVAVYQRGLVVHYDRFCDNAQLVPPVQFSADLTDSWTIPGLEFVPTC